MNWVTRARPKVDRLACAWLITRFVDPDPTFVFVPAARVADVVAETGAIPFDVPGVELGHVGDTCSFDAFLRKYDVRHRALPRLAAIVRGADTGRLDLTPQSAGLQAIAGGMLRLHADDRALLDRGLELYEELFAWSEVQPDWRPR